MAAKRGTGKRTGSTKARSIGASEPIVIETQPHGAALAALRTLNEASWRTIVAEHLKLYKSVPRASLALGVAPNTLRSWISEDDDLSRIKLTGRGRPEVAKGYTKADLQNLVKQAGGIDTAAEVAGITVPRLRRILETGSMPVRVLDLLKAAAKARA